MRMRMKGSFCSSSFLSLIAVSPQLLVPSCFVCAFAPSLSLSFSSPTRRIVRVSTSSSPCPDVRLSFTPSPSSSLLMTASSSSSSSTATTTATATATNVAARPRLVQGIRDIVNDYDIFLLDMWGVMHDGSKPYDGVLEVIAKLALNKKRLVILSNSSKRQDHSIKMLRKLGFDPADFEKIITSGEVAYQMLKGQGEWLRYCQPWEPLLRLSNTLEKESSSSSSRRRAFCFGSGEDDAAYLSSCGWTLADTVESADLLVARGTFTVESGTARIHKRDDPDEYQACLNESLQRAAQRRTPMIVCNPDKVRPDVERPPMPGMIGDLYEAALMDAVRMGGDGDGDGAASLSKEEAEALVKRVGKPDRDVYDIALEQEQGQPPITVSRPRACMIGDALETDVTGGSAIGIDTIWVLCDGIHSPDLVENDSTSLEDGAMAVLEAFNQQQGTYAKGRKLAPTVLLRSFVW